QKLAVLGRGRAGFDLARKLLSWSPDVTLCTDGASGLSRREKAELERLRIGLRREPVERLEGRGSTLESVHFRSAPVLERDALFFTLGWELASDLAQSLGCRLTRHGCISTGARQQADVPGLWVVGDATPDVQLVVVAAAEGAKAAIHLHEWMLEQDLAHNFPAGRTALEAP
ncbi:MAG: FAD-dependent oxidoreductase, partial [Thermoanaerobaculia bacterium]